MSNSILGLASASQRPNLHYPIVDPKTLFSYDCPPHSGWRYSKETMARKIQEGRIIFPKKQNGRPREKKFLSELSSEHTGFSSILNESVGYTLNGSRELRDLFEGKIFDFPKPLSLLSVLVEQGMASDDIILDFFSGSATIAHAVMSLNIQDGGKRRYILVQLPEVCGENTDTYKAGYKTIAEIGKERIRRAGKKIKEENTDNPDIEQLDIGFRVLKVDTSNMKEVYYSPDTVQQYDLLAHIDNICEDRTSEDLLFQVLLDWGVDLTLPITQKIICSKTVFFVDQDAIVACFDENINEEIVKELASYKPLRIVFRDASFDDDSVKINVEQIFKHMSPGTEIKTI
jgi:adenine-specific DNA-methyltransferase